MKKLTKALLLAMLSFAAFSCEDDDNPVDPGSNTPTVTGQRDSQGRIILQGEIKTSGKLVATEKYILQGFVYVMEGATLEIEPGTVIFGDKASKGSLIIERGAKIIANGTATRPIVFTSAQPAGSRTYGDWGGLVLVGRAPANQVANLEGGLRGSFGGSDVADNSGSLKYVRIEFAGVPLTQAANSEINGLTMYGVGSGTTLDYIQVSYCGDDSFEWFGGAVNAKHLVAFRGFDDDFDADLGYRGKVQYAVSLRDPQYADQSGSNGFEIDNFNPGVLTTGTPTEGNGLPITAPVFSNVSVFVTAGAPVTAPQSGSGSYQSAMHLRRNSAPSIYNSVLVGYPEGLRLDGIPTWNNAQATTGDVLTLKGVVLANNNTQLRVANNTTGTAPNVTTVFTLDQLTSWFSQAGKNNQLVASTNLSTLGLNTASFNLTAPVFTPQAGSSLLTGASFDGKAADGFFDKVAFKGAFGSENWAQGWTNFNPQNATY